MSVFCTYFLITPLIPSTVTERPLNMRSRPSVSSELARARIPRTRIRIPSSVRLTSSRSEAIWEIFSALALAVSSKCLWVEQQRFPFKGSFLQSFPPLVGDAHFFTSRSWRGQNAFPFGTGFQHACPSMHVPLQPKETVLGSSKEAEDIGREL